MRNDALGQQHNIRIRHMDGFFDPYFGQMVESKYQSLQVSRGTAYVWSLKMVHNKTRQSGK